MSMQPPTWEDGVGHWATGRLLSTAARLAEHAWDSYLSQWGLNHASFGALAVLATGPETQQTLSRHLHLQAQTTSRMVERLERQGYVQRSPHVRDRRALLVSLTEAGREVFEQARDSETSEDWFRTNLGAAGVEQFREQLVTLVSGLSANRWGGTG